MTEMLKTSEVKIDYYEMAEARKLGALPSDGIREIRFHLRQEEPLAN